MIATTLPGPDPERPRQEHLVAGPERPAALVERIADEPGTLERLRGRHVVSVAHFDRPLMLQLMRLAARYEQGELSDTHPLRGRVLSNLFLDQSQCTGRLAFNAAWIRLGGQLLDLEPTVGQILSRRYALDEVAEICSTYSDCAVLRTADAETFHDMLPRFRVPVINAGDGPDEQPVHAMADLYTLFKWRPELLEEDPPRDRRLQIALIGDPSRSRVMRSFLRMLTLFPKAVERVVLMQRLARGFAEGQREELEQAGIRVQTLDELCPTAADMDVIRELMPVTDLVYVHQLHRMQVSRMQLEETVSLLKPDAMFLIPEVQNETTAHILNASPHNGFFTQARGSVFVRMALFASVMG